LNRIKAFIPELYELVQLEEINLVWMEMEGFLTGELKNLKRLKHFNLSYNKIVNGIPDFTEWDEFTDLETIEL